MPLKTDAIVLKTQKIKDNAIIVTLYTQEIGRSSFLLYGAHSKQKRNAISFLHPLSIIHIESNFRNNRDLNILSETKQEYQTPDILFNPIKSSIAFFIAELLLHVLRTNEQDPTLFEFLKNSILILNHENKNLSNFHIAFLLKLTRFLGFEPCIDNFPHQNLYFDMKQVEFTHRQPEHQFFLKTNETEKMRLILRMNYHNFHLFRFSRLEREEIINRILEYYKIHLHGIGEIKSIYVLKEIFN